MSRSDEPALRDEPSAGPVTVELAIDAIRTILVGSEREHIPVTPASGLEDLGLSSLDVAEVFVLLEDLCGVELEPLSIEQLGCVADLVGLRPAADALPDELRAEIGDWV